jgi:Fic family protein
MTWFIFLLIGFGVGYYFGRRAAMGDPKLKQVLALFDGGGEIFNDQVQTALGVSDATATRYLDELEKTGKIIQVGSTGRGVIYRKK